MSKLLTEEEYNALLADRERLNWCIGNNVTFISGHDEIQFIDGSGNYVSVTSDNMWEAIDHAMDGKCG